MKEELLSDANLYYYGGKLLEHNSAISTSYGSQRPGGGAVPWPFQPARGRGTAEGHENDPVTVALRASFPKAALSFCLEVESMRNFDSENDDFRLLTPAKTHSPAYHPLSCGQKDALRRLQQSRCRLPLLRHGRYLHTFGSPPYRLARPFKSSKNRGARMRKEPLDSRREGYPPGMLLELIEMEGEQDMPPGLKGTVVHVDDIG